MTRGFAACKREPCRKCVACPRGTTSSGGPATAEAGVAAQCTTAGAVTFSQTIFASATGQPLACRSATQLSSLMVASLRSQAALGVSLLPGPRVVVTSAALQGDGTTCAYDVTVSYNGQSAVQGNIETLSRGQVVTTGGFSGGVCE